MTQCLFIKSIIEFTLLKDITTWHTQEYCIFVNVTSNGTYIYRWFTGHILIQITWYRKKSVVSFMTQAEAEATFCSRQFRFQQLSNLHVAVWCSLFDFTSRQRTVPLNFATQFVPVILLIPVPVQTECMRHNRACILLAAKLWTCYYVMAYCCLQTLTDCMCLGTGNAVTSPALEKLESSKKSIRHKMCRFFTQTSFQRFVVTFHI